jgi:hypothetical protein
MQFRLMELVLTNHRSLKANELDFSLEDTPTAS